MSEKTQKKLTEKQKRFIDYYIQTANASESARLAGYKGKNLHVIGCENLTKLNKEIQERMQAKRDSRIATQDEVLMYLTDVLRGKLPDATIKDRNKSAELLGKRYGLYIEKQEVEANLSYEKALREFEDEEEY